MSESADSSLLGVLVRGPDREDAVRVGDEQLSSAGLLAAAGTVGHRIRGARAVAVVASPSLETIASVVGCLLAGVPVVPVPPDAGPLERGHILADSGADVLFETAAPAPVELSPPATACPPARGTAMVLYTSGTTGPPKGVQLSAAAIAFDLDALAEAWAWTADDVLVHGLPLFHAHGLVLGVLGALRVGSPLVHTVRPTAEAYAGAAGSLYFGVPTVWSRVCADETSASALRSARLLVSGSAPLPGSVFARLADLTGSSPVERYGLTETLILTSTLARGPRRQGSVGFPLGGVESRLVDEDGSALPADGRTVGELEVRTPAIFMGYLGRPAATATSFRPDGWFRTGDVAVVDPDGSHRIVGRRSVDLIKSGGYRIGAGEVEGALLGHPGVREAAVVGVPDPDLGQRIVAYVVVDVGVAGRELQDYVAERLSVHKRPRQVHLVDSLPRNGMGKVVKGQLLGDGFPAGGP